MKKLSLLLITALVTLCACNNTKPHTESDESSFASLEDIFNVFDNGSFELTYVDEKYQEDKKNQALVRKDKLLKEKDKLEYLFYSVNTNNYKPYQYLYLEEVEDNRIFHRYSMNYYETWYEEVVEYEEVSNDLYKIDMLYEMFKDIQNGGTEDYNVEWVYDQGVYQATVDLGPNEGITTVTVTLSKKFFKTIKTENVKGDLHENLTITASNVGKTVVELPSPLINDLFYDLNAVGNKMLEQTSYRLDGSISNFETGDALQTVSTIVYEVIQRENANIIRITKEDKDPFIIMERFDGEVASYYIANGDTWNQYPYTEYLHYSNYALVGSFLASFTEEQFKEFVSVIQEYEPGHFIAIGPQSSDGPDNHTSIQLILWFDNDYLLKTFALGILTQENGHSRQHNESFQCSGVGTTTFAYPTLP